MWTIQVKKKAHSSVLKKNGIWRLSCTAIAKVR